MNRRPKARVIQPQMNHFPISILHLSTSSLRPNSDTDDLGVALRVFSPLFQSTRHGFLAIFTASEPLLRANVTISIDQLLAVFSRDSTFRAQLLNGSYKSERYEGLKISMIESVL